MKTTAKITIFLALFILVAGSIALAQPGRRGSGRWHRGPADANAPGPRGFDQWAAPRQGSHGQFGSRGQGFGPGPQKGPGREFPMLHLLRRLDLTEEQQKQVKTILDNNRKGAKAADKTVGEAMQAVHKAVMDEAGEEAIRKAAAEAGTALGNQAVLKAQTAASVKGVLTEEQVKRLETIKEKMQKLHEDMEDLQEEFGPRQHRRGTGYGQKGRHGSGRRGGGMRGHRPPGPPPMQQQW
ncbi:MAG: Spy/CpxP family protein refolding chaperone [Planctomycetota bacterium]